MEAIFSIIGIIIFYAVIGFVMRLLGGTVKATYRTVTGKGTFSENFDYSINGMKPIEAKIVDTFLDKDTQKTPVKEIFVKGLFPISKKTKLSFITSVFDNTSGEFERVHCFLDTFQEEKSYSYHYKQQLDYIDTNVGFVSWVRVGFVATELLHPPYGGKRKLVAFLRLIDENNPPSIFAGFHDPDGPAALWKAQFEFYYDYKGKGFIEIQETRNDSKVCVIKFAVSVATIDKDLSDEAGNTIKDWIVKQLDKMSDLNKTKYRDIYNRAFQTAYADCMNDTFIFSKLISEVNQYDDESLKYEIVEFCIDVMSKNSKSAAKSLTLIRNIAQSLELELSEVEKLKDKKLLHVNTASYVADDNEVLLGVDPAWPKDKIQTHLRSEFQKWNNRLNSLDDSNEKANAQNMLNIIANLRKKYE